MHVKYSESSPTNSARSDVLGFFLVSFSSSLKVMTLRTVICKVEREPTARKQESNVF